MIIIRPTVGHLPGSADFFLKQALLVPIKSESKVAEIFIFFSLGFLLIWKIIRGADWKKSDSRIEGLNSSHSSQSSSTISACSMLIRLRCSLLLTFLFLGDFRIYFAAYTFRKVKCYYSHYNVVPLWRSLFTDNGSK